MPPAGGGNDVPACAWRDGPNPVRCGLVRNWARLMAVGACATTALLGAAGCGTTDERQPAATASGVASPAPTLLRPTRWPAAAAGGACQLLDYGAVEQTLGLTFEVAAGGQQDATYTCVLQRAAGSVPDLALAVTPSGADPAIFRSTVMPKGAAALNGLGKVGYRAAVAAVPKSNRGPGVEIGWLSGNNRIVVLRITLPLDAAPAAVNDAGGKLAELAKQVDQASIGAAGG